MSKYITVLFDIDGTLCDPGDGIVNGIKHALSEMGVDEQDHAKLRRFVGPPLGHTLQNEYNFSQQQAHETIGRYRAHHGENGINEYVAYPTDS